MGLYVGKMDEKLGNMEIVENLRNHLGKELERTGGTRKFFICLLDILRKWIIKNIELI